MATVKAMREKAKNDCIDRIIAMLGNYDEDVAKCGTNEINFPIVHEDGTEDFIVIKVSIPTGSRDGEPYDGYGMRDEYNVKMVEKEVKAKAAADAKAKKIAQDKARREKLAASKAAHTAQ